MPMRARESRTRVLVMNIHIALVGGNCDLADFQVMPPLGRSMLSAARGGPLRHPQVYRESKRHGARRETELGSL